jgi:agmatine deiminase
MSVAEEPSMTWLMPAEHEPHDRTLISWPTDHGVYGPLVDAAREAYAQVAQVIAEHEPVTMLAAPSQAEIAHELCGSKVEILPIEMDDSWIRDSGPIYQVDRANERRRATVWKFNGYGHKYPHDLDSTLAARWCASAGHEVVSVPMVLEGGSIITNGQDLLVTTMQCLLHPNRNPTMGRQRIETTLQECSGMSQVIWLPYGLSRDHDTDGHVDNVAAFAPDGQLIVQTTSDPHSPDSHRLNTNLRWLDAYRDSHGQPLRIVEIPVLPEVEYARRLVSVPYLNFYVANGLVIVPTSGHAADTEMLSLLAEQFPNRRVVGLDVGPILAYGGGGIHCITQQIPA